MTETEMLQRLVDLHAELVRLHEQDQAPPVTRSADSYENELRYLREMCTRMNQKLQALTNDPESHTDRGLTRDPVCNRVARKIDRERGR